MKFQQQLATLLTVLGTLPARYNTSAFVLSPPPTGTSSCLVTPSTTCNKASLDDEFETAFQPPPPKEDDFYADYDPSKYERSTKSDNGSNYGGGGGGYDTNDRSAGPRSDGRGGGGRGRGGRGGRGDSSSSRKPKQYLGPNGHDYELSSDAGPNNSKFDNESSIHALLAERLQAKFSRDFRTADEIQMELIDGGVFVHDGMKEWRADGIPYGSFNGGGSGQTNSRSLDRQQYSKSPHSDDVVTNNDGVVNNELITKLVLERTKFKMMRQYDKADAVREGLRTKFNVMIDDRLKQWSVGGDFGEENNAQRELADKFSNRGYIKSTSSLSLEDQEEEEYIQFHVDARVQAKKDRNFEAADKIRLDLAQRFDVMINDKMKLWSIGGLFEELGGKMGKPRGVYTRRGALGDLSPEGEDAVTKLITDRYHAKKQKAFDVADEIRDELMNKYNVRIDDRSNEWRVDTEDYAMAGSNSLSEDEVAFIDGKLKERFYFKREREFEDADAIRDHLQERFGIQVDDRVKEWYVDSLLSGVGVVAAEAKEEDVE